MAIQINGKFHGVNLDMRLDEIKRTIHSTPDSDDSGPAAKQAPAGD